MPYSFVLDVPIDERMYQDIRAEIGEETPPGLLVHLVTAHDGGLRYVDVWESEADWNRFRSARVGPAIGKVHAAAGIGPVEHPQPQVQDVIDVWMGDA